MTSPAVSSAPTSSPLPAMAADLAAIALFALLARLAHGGLSLSAWAQTVWPWLIGAGIGWVLLLSIARPARSSRWREAGIIWGATIVGGMAVWAVVNGSLPHWSFLLVAALMSALLLGGWRALAGLAARRQR